MDIRAHGLDEAMLEMLRALDPFPTGVEGPGAAGISLADEADDRRMRTLIEDGYVHGPGMRPRGDGRVGWSLQELRLSQKARRVLREVDAAADLHQRLTPSERMGVMRDLAAKSGGDLYSFFVAVGYGAAYKRAGGGASKATCVAEAVAQAEAEARDGEVLAAAIQHFGLSTSPGAEGPRPSPLRRATRHTIQEDRMPEPDPTLPTAAFIVHGRDAANIRHVVARLISAATALEPVILDEQLNEGRTLIDKFKAHATPACVAIVVMTADDVGRAANAPGEERRPRQNVVLELGYFLALLPPDRVIVLRESGLTGPSDVQGVMYHSLDDAGWGQKLAREIAGLGVAVDFKRVT